jgi:hypothetical protein
MESPTAPFNSDHFNTLVKSISERVAPLVDRIVHDFIPPPPWADLPVPLQARYFQLAMDSEFGAYEFHIEGTDGVDFSGDEEFELVVHCIREDLERRLRRFLGYTIDFCA